MQIKALGQRVTICNFEIAPPKLVALAIVKAWLFIEHAIKGIDTN